MFNKKENMNICFIGARNAASGLGFFFANAGQTLKYDTPHPVDHQLLIRILSLLGKWFVLLSSFQLNGVLSANKEALKGKISVDITNAILILLSGLFSLKVKIAVASKLPVYHPKAK